MFPGYCEQPPPHNGYFLKAALNGLAGQLKPFADTFQMHFQFSG